MSCVFSATTDLNAQFPAVAARDLGLNRVPLLCTQEIDVPGALPRVIRVLLHYYAADGHAPQHVYLRRGARAARGPRIGPVSPRNCAMPVIDSVSWFRHLHRAPGAHPALLGRGRQRRTPPRGRRRSVAMLASNESPFPPVPGGRRGGAARRRRGEPLSRPGRGRAAARAVGPLRATRRPAIAVGNGSCEILLAAAEALLEPCERARLRVARLLHVSAPGRRHRREGAHGAADRRLRARPRRDGRRRSPT